MKPKLRVSSSIEPFKEKAEKALGLETYYSVVDGYDTPVVFLGLYHKSDYQSFRRPRIKRYVLWCGGDIQNFKRGYLYGDGEKVLWKSKIASFFPWRKKIIKTEAEHFCENEDQRVVLEGLGIKASVVPAFWGNVDDFPISFKPAKPFQIYICGHPGREEEYGFDHAETLAGIFQNIEFHFYGAEIKSDKSNVIGHGIAPEEQFNKEIRNYHCLLRLNEHDGFSDCLAKSILMGQYPITKIKHPYIWHYNNEHQLIHLLKRLQKINKPNIEGRKYYHQVLNQYLWNKSVK